MRVARSLLNRKRRCGRAYGRAPADRGKIAEMAQQHPPARQMHGGQKRGEQDQRGEITARIPAADRLRRRSRLAPRRADQPLDRIPDEGHDPEKNGSHHAQCGGNGAKAQARADIGLRRNGRGHQGDGGKGSDRKAMGHALKVHSHLAFTAA
jgi:hypothetical protein